ncbi:hypothetical protein YC2023_084837 [Brassica napus]
MKDVHKLDRCLGLRSTYDRLDTFSYILIQTTMLFSPPYSISILLSNTLINTCIGNRKMGETALMYVTLVNRTLSQEEKIPQVSFDLVFEKEFELSHSLVRGSVYFIGYKTPDLDE